MVKQNGIKRSFLQTAIEFTDPTVLKYSILSIVLASLIIWWSFHFAIERGVSFFIGLLPINQWLPELNNFKGITSFILAFLLFSLAMPLISTTIYPVMGFFQIVFFESFANEFQKKHYYKYNMRKLGTITNLLIYFKWTILKFIIFIILSPLFHLPVIGWILHLFLITLWISLVYNEIVQKKYCEHMSFIKCLKENLGSLAKVAVTVMALSYFIVWMLLYISLAIPPIRIVMLFILTITIISANYVMAAEFIHACINNETIFVRELKVIPNSRIEHQ